MNKENCALKLVDEIILYYDARSKKHQTTRGFSYKFLGNLFIPFVVSMRPLFCCFVCKNITKMITCLLGIYTETDKLI